MKIQRIKLVLTLLIVLLTIRGGQSQQSTTPNPAPKPSPSPTPSPAPPQFTQDELEQRFNAILARQLSADNVFLSFTAAVRLEDIVEKAARRIADNKSFEQLPDADKNLDKFARALRSRGAFSEGTIISTTTITDVLDGFQIQNPKSSDPQFIPGVCPLFPICP